MKSSIKADVGRAGHSFFRCMVSPKVLIIISVRLYQSFNSTPWGIPFAMAALIMNKVLQYITGIQLSVRTQIGEGLLFPHHSSIVIAQETIVGKNCTILQGVTIGRNFGRGKVGCPIIGDNCVFLAGAKVIGNIKIGNNVIIGANAVVTKDIPDNCVVAGVPASIVSTNSKSCMDEQWAHYFKLM